MVLSNDLELGKKINSAAFPGLQGGPLMHAIASKAAAFGEALRPEFRHYAQAVVDNAKTLARAMVDEGFDIVTGGPDNHLMLVDLPPNGLTGDVAAKSHHPTGRTRNQKENENETRREK